MLKNPLPNLQYHEFQEVPFKELMQKRVYNVLIVCSNYDYYLIEEDGRIDEQIFNEYATLNLRYPPNFLHASSAKKAIDVLQTVKIDLVITFLDLVKGSFETAQRIKLHFPDVPIVALSHYSDQLRQKLIKENAKIIDDVFHWNGDVDIFLAIIKLTEDRMNAEKDILGTGVKAILLVEDSMQFYSRYLPLIYKVILNQTLSFMQEELNEHSKMMSKRGRPKILLAKSYEEAVELFEKYKKHLLGVISDVSYPKDGEKDAMAGFKLLEYVRKYQRYFPFLIQSSNIKNQEVANFHKAKFLFKHSETLEQDLKRYITKYLSFGDFEFWDPTSHKIVAVAKDLRELQKGISIVPIESIVYHSKRNEFSKWLQSRALFPLANLFAAFEFEDFSENDQVKEFLAKAVRQYRHSKSRGIIAKFDKDEYDEYLVFSRIGDGALGGKARGLAFINSFLKRHKRYNKYQDITISIPRTVVLSTQVFDEFMESHNLFSLVADGEDDDTILNEFISKPLPQWAVDDVSAFLKTTKVPVAVRSSSVLEDTLYQPFAGVFSTYMVPNTDQDLFLEMVLNAIKSVMASAFYKNSKAYIKATNHAIEESKMAVVLQEVVGVKYDDLFFPNVSGVARSVNFYPIGDEKPEEGIAQIALGLGEIIVGGGQTLRFSPYHPKKVLQLSNVNSAQRDTQKTFYGLEMNPGKYHTSTDEEVNKRLLSIRSVKNHPALKFVASTYDLQNNVIKPGVFEEGIRVITFDHILKYNSFPLAEILQDLLKLSHGQMSSPVEMEFAVKLDVPPGEPKVFSFLQLRPIVEEFDLFHTIPDEIDPSETVILSNAALGNGKYDGIHDIVYVKPDSFNPAKTREIASEVEKINRLFDDNGKNYILVGPGRWGSSDPWLGIPVVWSQISHAKVIIESGLHNFRVDPSQGTHFFQNLTSFKVGYLTLNPYINDGFYDIDYLNQQEAVFENEYIRHIQFNKPLLIIIEGGKNKAVIYKENHMLDTPILEEE
jgi:hypothetical protein